MLFPSLRFEVRKTIRNRITSIRIAENAINIYTCTLETIYKSRELQLKYLDHILIIS
jgi:hypothetical protein